MQLIQEKKWQKMLAVLSQLCLKFSVLTTWNGYKNKTCTQTDSRDNDDDNSGIIKRNQNLIINVSPENCQAFDVPLMYLGENQMFVVVLFFLQLSFLTCTSQQSTSQRFRPLETLHVIQSVQEGALLWTPPQYGVLVSSFHTLLNSTSHRPKRLKIIYLALANHLHPMFFW